MLDEFGPIMSVQDVCDTLHVGKNTVYRLIQEGKIDCFRTGRVWKIKRNGLADYIRTASGITSERSEHHNDL